MFTRMQRLTAGLVAGVVASSVLTVSAFAGVQAQVELQSLHCIQTYSLDDSASDQIFLLGTGVAAGKTVSLRIPETGTISTSPKKPAILPAKAVTLLGADLGEGQFAVLTVALFQGVDKADPAKAAKFIEQVAAAHSKIEAITKPTLDAAGFKALTAELAKADKQTFKDAEKSYSRKAGGDHLGGLYTLVLWNNAGKIEKRLTPVGLTHGEHFGTDVKAYSKLKYTLANVLVQEDGQWTETEFPPLSDDGLIVYIKSLETDVTPVTGAPEPVRNVTDYLSGVQLKVDGKPAKWKLGGENTGPTEIHTFWDYAE